MELEQSFDLRGLLWKVGRNIWLILLPIIAAFCIAFIYYKTASPVYESFVIVTMGDATAISPALEPLVRPERIAESNAERAMMLDGRIHSRSFLTTLTQRIGFLRDPVVEANAKKVAKHFPGLSPEEYALRTAIMILARQIRTAPVRGPLVRIVAQSSSPEFAQQVANAIATLLVEQSREQSMGRAQARGTFSSDQLSVYQERLRRSEEALRTFQESLIGRNLSASVINDGNLSLARSLDRLNREEMDQIRARIADERAAWEASASSSAALPDLASSETRRLETRLGDLEVSFASATLGRETAAGDAALIQAKIADVRQGLFADYQALAAALPGSLSETARSAVAGLALDRSILRSLKEKGDRLSGWLNAFTGTVQNSPRDQIELERLRNNVEANRAVIIAFQKEMTSSRLTEALESSDLGAQLDVVETAQIPITPVAPDRLRIFGAALLLGPLFSIGILFGLERLAGAVRSVADVERELGVPVIGTLPRIEGWGPPGSFLRAYWPVFAIVLVLLVTSIFYATQLSTRPTGRAASSSTSPQHR